MGLRRALAVNAGKAAAATSRFFGKGGGTALPGLVAARIDPDIVSELASQLRAGSVVVAGTNGKTTTSRMLAAIFRQAGYAIVRNDSGSNLARGLASTLLMQTNIMGDLPHQERLGVFEVDEAALPAVLRMVTPSTLLLLDLFRDQLDRYGEVATVARVWTEALQCLSPGTRVVINADDPLLVELASHATSPPLFFGVQSAERSLEEQEHGSDVKSCPRCGAAIGYEVAFLSHLGHYRCTSCDLLRPNPDVYARDVRADGLDGSRFLLGYGGEEYSIILPLPGLYNVYNAAAAAAASLSLGIAVTTVVQALETVTPAFGRMERLRVGNRTLTLALAKNPTGLNEVLRTLLQGGDKLHLLVMLSDNAADGRDVSWIWDADVEMLRGRVRTVVFSGTRAEDMALRFKYAGALPEPGSWSIEHDAAAAVDVALRQAAGADLFAVPTYTALLDLREVLVQRGLVRPYWEE